MKRIDLFCNHNYIYDRKGIGYGITVFGNHGQCDTGTHVVRSPSQRRNRAIHQERDTECSAHMLSDRSTCAPIGL